ncbi:hypothetical protein ACFSTH_18935 [Paenibacillus yanchengensis]|uniref:Cellulase Ig-like domain-containing protein n=1 Tax=Paenibacillus yanchengensis TaxID=2035833 RepID=A0ABW4YLQ5_9BACL
MWQWQGEKLFYDNELIGTACSNVQQDIAYRDEIKSIEDGVFQITRTLMNKEATAISLTQCQFTFTAVYQAEETIIPAVMYNGNNWGEGAEPKGYEVNGEPYRFAYHRVAIAGATYSASKEWAVALFGGHQTTAFACALQPTDEATLHHLYWPLQEGPKVYSARGMYSEEYKEKVELAPNETVVLTAYLVVTRRSDSKQPGYAKLLDIAWRLDQEQQEARNSPRVAYHQPEALWNYGVTYARESLWAEDGIFKGFSIGMIEQAGELKQRPTWKYKIGWTGQNIALGCALLYDYIRNGNQSSLEKGLLALDSWAEHARLPNGLIRCHFDYLLADHPTDIEIQDACHLGAAATHFFEAAQLVEQCKVEKPLYRQTALAICDFIVQSQAKSGQLAKAWYNDGTVADPEGTIGAALVEPLTIAYIETKEEQYLLAAKRAYDFYYNEFLLTGYTTAGALDSSCIDKEAAIPLLKAGIALYKLTNEASYLQAAETASWYLASWQWHYSTKFPTGSPLAELQYDTHGGTSVSTLHHHMDSYALDFVTEWIELSELTGNKQWAERAQAAWVNATVGISDGDLIVNNSPKRPYGSQDEGFYHTNWCFSSEKERSFSVSGWLVAWPTAFRLNVLRKNSKWDKL